jgi:hypothetical protein
LSHNNIAFGTHINGSKQIDFLLCSDNLLGFINKTGSLDFQEGFDSNHRGLFFGISSDIFTKITEDVIPCTRQIGTNSTNKEGDRYIWLLDFQFVQHRVYDKILKLCEDINNEDENKKLDMVEKIIKLDKIITDLMLMTDRRCCKPKEISLWTPELYQSNLLIQYFNISSKSEKQQINLKHRLECEV